MEQKTRKGPVKVITPAAPKSNKPKKKRYYPPKAKQPAAKIQANKKLDGNLASAKLAEKAAKEVVQPEPASFVWVDDTKQTWLQKVVAWLTSIGK